MKKGSGWSRLPRRK